MEEKKVLNNEDLEKVVGGVGTDGYGVAAKFVLILLDVGVGRKQVIRVVKEMKGIRLAEAIALVDALPCTIGEYDTEEHAITDKLRLESYGCSAAIQLM